MAPGRRLGHIESLGETTELDQRNRPVIGSPDVVRVQLVHLAQQLLGSRPAPGLEVGRPRGTEPAQSKASQDHEVGGLGSASSSKR